MYDEKNDWQRLVRVLTLNSLRSAADVCRLRCQNDPDLMDAMAAGIYEFLCDGDIYEHMVRHLFEIDPAYFGRIVFEMEEPLAKKLVEVGLGQAEPEPDFWILEGEAAQELHDRFEKALAEGTGPITFTPPISKKE